MDKKPKILFVCPYFSTFIQKDLDILRKHFDVKPIQWTGSIYVTKLLKIVKYVYKTDLSFITFADRHAARTIFFSKLFRKRSIVVVGGYDVANVPEIGYGLMISPKSARRVKYVLENADKVLTVDESLKKDAINNAGVGGQNIQTVYRCYDSNKWKFDGEKENMVITVANIKHSVVKRKGLETFVKAAKYLPNTKFILIGPHVDNSVEYLKSIAPSNVEFTGFIPNEELPKWYGRAKVYCQLSRYEGIPNALCEAMLCECVPVGTRYCGIPTAIGDTGFYVPYGDLESTAEAIKKALESGKGKAARERIKSNFPLEKREKELVNIINRILEEPYYAKELFGGQNKCLTYMKEREKKQKMLYKNKYHKIFTPEDIERRVYSRLYQDKLDWIMNFMKNKNNKKILDVGCGFGRVSIPLAKKTNNTIIGLDISLNMLNHAKKNIYCDAKTINNLHFILGDAERLPLKDNSVDYVISLDITPHLMNPIDHLKELKRITKQDSSILVDFSNKNPLWMLAYPRFILFKLLLNCYHLFFKRKLLFKHRKRTSDFKRQLFPYSKKEAEDLLSIAGLRSDHWIKFGLIFAPKFLLACIKIQRNEGIKRASRSESGKKQENG